MSSTVFSQRLSLLWPDPSQELPPISWHEAAPDLELGEIARALSIHPRYTARILKILHTLTTDPNIILYRQDILEDLLKNPDFSNQLEKLLAQIDSFDHFAELGRKSDNQLHQVVYRMGELSNYLNCISMLCEMLTDLGDNLQSQALRTLREMASSIENDPSFIQLQRELPAMLAKIENVHSITIGVNLNSELSPIGATLLSVNTFRFKGASSMLSRLFRGNGEKPEEEGIADLHSYPGYREVRTMDSIVIPDEVTVISPMLVPLLKDLAQIMDKLSGEIVKSLREYMKVDVGFLMAMRDEMAFYLGALRLIQRLQACGMPLCRPTLAPIEERSCEIENLYNINLALLYSEGKTITISQRIVLNSVNFGEAGRIFILTGPNQGGKTVFTQGLGLAQVLFQAGLYVPASSAHMSPVDGIYTHFAVAERISQQAGRLGEEARRLNAIFAAATPYSLLLLNESFSSTSAGESLYLARDIVRVMRRLGTRAVFATHLHDLAADCANINSETKGDSLVASLVSMMTEGENAKRSYKIIPAPPMGKSYAQEIAAQYGISYEQLEATLRARNLIQGDD
jgi:DNA mismatch repair protein MutS